MAFNFSSKPNRRYLVRVGCSTVVYMLSFYAATYPIRFGLVGGSLLVWVLALIPGLAAVGVLYACVMLIIEQEDEFIRMLILRQWVIGTCIALSFAAAWGFLEHFGLVAHINPYWIMFAWLIGFSTGGLVNRISHGAWGELS